MYQNQVSIDKTVKLLMAADPYNTLKAVRDFFTKPSGNDKHKFEGTTPYYSLINAAISYFLDAEWESDIAFAIKDSSGFKKDVFNGATAYTGYTIIKQSEAPQPMTNTEILMFIIGWQGGTIYMLADAMGVHHNRILTANYDDMQELCRIAQTKRNQNIPSVKGE